MLRRFLPTLSPPPRRACSSFRPWRAARPARARNSVAQCSCAWEIEDCGHHYVSSPMFFACVKPYVLRRPNPLAAVAAGTRVVGRSCGMRSGAGRRGRCYGMYPIDPRLSRVAQRSVPRAFAGVMWGMRVGAATQKHRATLLRRAARARRAMGETSYTRGAGT